MRFSCPALKPAFLMMFFMAFSLRAQRTEELLKMDLEEIMNMDVTIFSVQGLTQRQTPGVLTVISKEEIDHCGARDLLDLLNQVPGFNFGLDQQSVISLGIRGTWAQEGKVLLMVDGIEMNEILYSCLALGDHYPVEHIERIEIIRGPGTSFYGGYAELAVINIITQSAAALNGFESIWKFGRTRTAESRNSAALNFGKKISELKVKLLTYGGRSIRSDRDYTDAYGNTVAMKSVSDIRPTHVNMGVDYRRFKSNFIFDRYIFNQQDAYDQILPVPIDVEFRSTAGKMTYDIPVGKQWTITPGFSYLHQAPWKSVGQEATENNFFYHNIAERIKANLILKGNIAEKIQLISGTEWFVDRARVSDETPDSLFFRDGKKKVQYRQNSLFAQAFYTHGNTIPSVGLRYDRHEQFGAAFLPWVGVTQILGKWSLKGLYGKTFRAPSIENLNINPSLEPEKTTTSELELGYQINDNAFIMVNYFHTRINGPIVYFLDPETETEYYGNHKRTGSQGFELESKVKGGWGYFHFSYSFYRAMHVIDNYAVENHPGLFLGFPAHKLSLSSLVQLSRSVSMHPSIVVSSERFGYATMDAESKFILSRFKPRVLADVYLEAADVFGSGWDAGFGIYNLANADYPFIQPYNSGHAPLPNLSRECVVRLRYRWNL
jgi:outer membrane cobalamin receptor